MAPHESSFSDLFVDLSNDEHSYSCEPAKISQCNCDDLSNTSRRVSFNKRVVAKKIIHVSDYTASEIRACWYNKREFEKIKNECIDEVSELINDESKVDKREIRGLEFFIESIVGARQEARQMGIWEVLQEQRLQQEEGSFDPEFIAEIYKNRSSLARVHGCIVGVSDRLATMSI